MAVAAFLSVTLVPVLMLLSSSAVTSCRSREPGEPGPHRLYRPVIAAVLRAKLATMALAVVALASRAPRHAAWAASSCRPERRHLFYMPTTLPALSVTKGGGTAADPEQDHQELSGGGLGASARRAAPRPPPTRRPWKCSRR